MTTAKPGAASVPHKGWTLALASLGLFMAALDTLVVTTALPALRVSLHASLGDLEWTVNAYNLAFACFMLLGSALGDRFGRRRMYALGLFVFAGASAIAATAPTVGVLIAARAGQGFGAAIVMPLTLTLISDAFPAEKRGVAIGMWGGVAGTAVAFGPVVGGAVLQGLNWHWIFWFNVPIGLVLVPLALTRLTESRGPHPHLDLGGVALSCVGLFALTWGLVRVSDDGWTSPQVLGPIVAGAVLVAVFLYWEGRQRVPMLRLALFRSRAFTAGGFVNFFMYAALFGGLFLLAQFFETGLGNKPLQAGLDMLAWTAAPMFVAPLAGALSDRFGSKAFMVAGMALQGAGMLWVALIAKPGMGYSTLFFALLVGGIGISLVFPTVANSVVNSVGPDDIGIASGTSSAMREVGGVFGVALAASVFSAGGVFSSSQVFVDHFRHAFWVAAALSAMGAIVALFSPGRAAAARDTVIDLSEASFPVRVSEPAGSSL